MVESIAPGIARLATRTATLPPATHTNSYALGSGQLLLVDPAPSALDEQQRWLDWVRSLVRAGAEPVAILVTHHHPDHAGGAAVLSQSLSLPLWAHELTAERLPYLRVERRLADGEHIDLAGPEPQRWAVLHTPGHAAGHLCLYERERDVLVAGDMVANGSPILVTVPDGDPRSYLEQLARLQSLDARLALPGHGDPIDDLGAQLARVIEQRAEREAKVLGALAQFGRVGATVDAILPLAYDDTPRALWPTAALSLRAHLGKLVADGAARLAADGERHIAS